MNKVVFAMFILISSPLFSDVTLNFADSNKAPERRAVIRYLLDAFELYNPKIRVNIVPFNDNDSIDAVLSGEDNLHMIMADSLVLYQLDERGLLNHDMPGMFLKQVGESLFFKGAIDAFHSDNEYFGVPYSAWLQVLWYRLDWFNNNDLPPPDNLDSIAVAAEYFKGRRDNRYGIITGTGEDIYTQQCFLHIAGACGLEIEEKKQGQYIDSGALTKALNYYKRLSRTTPAGANTWRYRDYFFQGKAAMLFYSTHLMDDIALEQIAEDSLSGDHFTELKGKEYSHSFFKNTGMVTIINGDEPSSFGSISGIGVFNDSNTEIINAQLKLLNFLYKRDVYISWLHMSPGGMLPVLKSVLDDDVFYRDLTGVLKKFGRVKVQELTGGLEFLKVINPENFYRSSETGYAEKDFQDLIFLSLTSDANITSLFNPEARINAR